MKVEFREVDTFDLWVRRLHQLLDICAPLLHMNFGITLFVHQALLGLSCLGA